MDDNLSAIRYDLTLRINFDDSTFDGSVVASFRLLSPSTTISLHSSRLQIQGARVVQNKRSLQPAATQIDESQTIVQFAFPSELSEGKLEMTIGFKGKISREELVGLFCPIASSTPSSAPIASKKSKQSSSNSSPAASSSPCSFVCTHFEPAYARMLFPCLDTPEQRATIRLSVTIPTQYSAVSNMPISRDVANPKEGNRTITFEETPHPMSTYLLSLACGNFTVTKHVPAASASSLSSKMQSLSLKLSKSVPISLYMPSTSSSAYPIDLALRTTFDSLSLLEDYFSIPFDLPKLDLVVIPRLCLSGMEGWGCIFLNEAYTSGAAAAAGSKGKASSSASSSTNRPLVELIVHEVAHQWCGNLVTLPFWIKEGIALYLEQYITDKLLGTSNLATSMSTLASSSQQQSLISAESEGHKEDDHDAAGGEEEYQEPKLNFCTCFPPGYKPHASLLTPSSSEESGGAPSALVLSPQAQFAALFAGQNYQKAFEYICRRAQVLGHDELRNRLRSLIADNKNSWIAECNVLSLLE